MNKMRWLFNRRGASTVEYVIILVAGVLLATILYNLLAGDEVKGSLIRAIENAINGESLHVDSQNQPPQKSNNDEKDTPDKKSPSKKEPGLWDKLQKKYKENELYIKCLTPDIVGYWACVNHDDFEQDAKDLLEDPVGYFKEVVGYDDWVDTWDKFYNIDYKEQWDKLIDDPIGSLKRKGSYLVDYFSDDPMGKLTAIGAEAVGWNDLQAWWTGKDPQTGEKLRVPNRIFRLATALPLPTKAGKATKVADKGVVNFLHGLACASQSRAGNSCSREGKAIEIPRDFNRQKDLDALYDEFQRLDFKLDDVPGTYKKLLEQQRRPQDLSNVKSVMGEYLMSRRIPEGYESLPTKVKSNNGLDGLYMKKNSKGEIEHIVIAEAKLGPDAGLGQTKHGKQMSSRWIARKAEEMKASNDPNTVKAGKMLDSVLKNKSFNNQQLSKGMIETRLFKVEPKDKNNLDGEWKEEWIRDPAGSGLTNDEVGEWK